MAESDVPGIRPDKAKIVCQCGHEFEARGNPCNVAPNQQVPARCPDCPVNGVIVHNKFSYIAYATGAITVEEAQ